MIPTASYRWNMTDAAEAFDGAAEHIHPFYTEIQQLVIEHLPFARDDDFFAVDLGGGSGRLIERILTHFPNARVANVDQSEPFLAISERRLRPFGDRAMHIERRLQDNWPAELPAAPRAIVSMSAIHHLDSTEKRALYRRCYDALAPRGIFINGDEFRLESDADYRAKLEWWATQKQVAEQRGLIPASFHPVFEAWYAQEMYLREAGFNDTSVPWSQEMWGILIGQKR